jgi:hypothetical protein
MRNIIFQAFFKMKKRERLEIICKQFFFCYLLLQPQKPILNSSIYLVSLRTVLHMAKKRGKKLENMKIVERENFLVKFVKGEKKGIQMISIIYSSSFIAFNAAGTFDTSSEKGFSKDCDVNVCTLSINHAVRSPSTLHRRYADQSLSHFFLLDDA